MKNRKTTRILILLLCLIAIVVVVFFGYGQKRKREEWAQQQLLAIDYREQNRALPRVSGHQINEEYYVGYDAIDESELYVCLVAYNEWIQTNAREEKELSLEDIKNYLSGEYNEDGSLRIHEGYENIRAYVNWYWEYEGAEIITEYWGALDNILGEYREQKPGTINSDARNLQIEQLQELIKKKNNPSYEINTEVMKGEG